MKSKFVFFLLVTFNLILFSSCSGEKSDKEPETAQLRKDSTSVTRTFKVREKLSVRGRAFVSGWNEYKNLENFIYDLKNADPGKILSYSDELARLAQQLKDSVRNETFKAPDYQIRLNVIDNEARRLHDMSTIPSISNEEVFEEYQRVIDAFSALISKINNEVLKIQIDDELRDFIDLVAKDTANIENTESFKIAPERSRPKVPVGNKPKIIIKKGDELKLLPIPKKEKNRP